MKAVVTGAAGFIGSKLVARLLEQKYEVVGIDNMIHGNLENISNFPLGQGLGCFSFQLVDVSEPKSMKIKKLQSLIRGCDIVFHLAAYGVIWEGQKHRVRDFKNNFFGTLRMLEACHIEKVKRFVFTSSTAQYGDPIVSPTNEDAPISSTSLYAASKASAEHFIQAYSQFSTFNSLVFRFSNVIGEGCRRGVIWDFVKKLKTTPKKLSVLGDGRQSKEFIHVDDVLDAIFIGLKNIEKKKFDAFNVAVPENRTVDFIADRVIEKMGLDGVLKSYSEKYIGDTSYISLDTSKLRSLGWFPKISTDEAIDRTIEWTIAHSNKLHSRKTPRSS